MRLSTWMIAMIGCGGGGATTTTQPPAPEPEPEASVTADVVGVRAVGDPGAYTLYVSVRSDETGCDQYADWWEVLTPEGDLVYRRVLTHSHPDEQPFERSGGPVPIGASDEVVVRAHLHPSGYGGEAMRGSVSDGFVAFAPEAGFADALQTVEPLPESCLF